MTPTPLDFLKAVYLNEGLPLNVRLRAAIEAARYFHPKLSATAVLQADDFAAALDRAVMRHAILDALRQAADALRQSTSIPWRRPTNYPRSFDQLKIG
jgi:hypothetical protein